MKSEIVFVAPLGIFIVLPTSAKCSEVLKPLFLQAILALSITLLKLPYFLYFATNLIILLLFIKIIKATLKMT